MIFFKDTGGAEFFMKFLVGNETDKYNLDEHIAQCLENVTGKIIRIKIAPLDKYCSQLVVLYN